MCDDIFETCALKKLILLMMAWVISNQPYVMIMYFVLRGSHTYMCIFRVFSLYLFVQLNVMCAYLEVLNIIS